MSSRAWRQFSAIWVGMAIFALFPGTGHGSDWKHIGAELNFWAQEGEGFLRGDLSSIPGTPIQLESDLGLETDVGIADGRVWLGAGGSHLVLSFYQSEYEGQTVLNQDLTFNGQTYSLGENVDSLIDNSVLGLYWYQTLIPLKVVTIGFQVGVDVLDLHATLDSSLTGLETVSETVPLPAVGLHLSIKPAAKFRIYADVSILSATVGGNDFDLTDGRAQIEFYFTEFFGLHGGYRLFDIDVDSDDFGALDYTQKGPFLGMTVRF